MSTIKERFLTDGKLDIDALFFNENLRSLEPAKIENRSRFRFFNWTSSWRLAPTNEFEMNVELLWGRLESELPKYYPPIGIDLTTGRAKWNSAFIVNIITPSRVAVGYSKRIVVPAYEDAEDEMRGFVLSHSRFGGEAGKLASEIKISEGQVEAVTEMAKRFLETRTDNPEKDIKLAIVTVE